MDVVGGIVTTIWTGFVGSIISGFIECLFLALAVDAIRRGHAMYLAAAVGLSGTLLARMSEGFMPATPNTILKVGGLLLAGVVLAIDLLTEEVEDTRAEAAP